MTDAIFGAVTSSFTAGGFVGSSCASVLLEKLGRRGALVLNSLCIALGSIAFAGSNSVTGLIAARYVSSLDAQDLQRLFICVLQQVHYRYW